MTVEAYTLTGRGMGTALVAEVRRMPQAGSRFPAWRPRLVRVDGGAYAWTSLERLMQTWMDIDRLMEHGGSAGATLRPDTVGGLAAWRISWDNLRELRNGPRGGSEPLPAHLWLDSARRVPVRMDVHRGRPTDGAPAPLAQRLELLDYRPWGPCSSRTGW